MAANSTWLIVFWIALVIGGLVVIGLALWWAIRSGQFSDQDRARYLPLDDSKPPDSELRRMPAQRPKKKEK